MAQYTTKPSEDTFGRGTTVVVTSTTPTVIADVQKSSITNIGNNQYNDSNKDNTLLLHQSNNDTIYLFAQLYQWQPFFTHCYYVHQFRNKPN